MTGIPTAGPTERNKEPVWQRKKKWKWTDRFLFRGWSPVVPSFQFYLEKEGRGYRILSKQPLLIRTSKYCSIFIIIRFLSVAVRFAATGKILSTTGFPSVAVCG